MENQTEIQAEIQPGFKTAVFGGFDKRSVVSYIFELNEEAKAAQERLTAQLEEVGAAREKLSAAIQELEQKLNTSEQARKTLSCDLEDERARSGELNEMIDTLNEEIRRQRGIIAEKDIEINKATQRAMELEQKNTELESKRREVEKVSVYVGELVVRARAEAEEILEDANNRAREIIDEATGSLNGVFVQFERFRTEMAAVEAKIVEAFGSMREKFTQLNETVDRAEGSVLEMSRPKSGLTLVTVENSDCDDERQEDFFRDSAGQ